MIKKHTEALSKSVIPLWREAFGDDDADILDAVRLLADSSRAVYLTEDGVRVAQAVAIDMTLGDTRGVYLYAVCVKESHRGRGLMRALLDACKAYATECGLDFMLLLPATEALAHTYERLGFSVHVPVSAPADITLAPRADVIPDGVMRFDGDFNRLHEASCGVFSRGALEYAISTFEETEIYYNEAGFTLFSYGRVIVPPKTSNAPSAYSALMMPLTSIDTENLPLAEPLPR